MKARAATLLGFLVVLHGLVLVGLWRQSEGRVAEGVAVVSVVPLILGGSYVLQRVFRAMTWLDIWVVLYALWSVASATLYLQDGNPTALGAYAYGLYHFALPIACYFATKSVPREQHRQLLSGLVLINAFVIGYGLYLHFTRPDYYSAFLTRILTPQGATEDWQFFARLQSYLGSTSVGYLGAVSLVLVTMAAPRMRRLLPILAIVFVVGTGLSLQRASFVALGLALAYVIFLSGQKVAPRVLIVVLFAGALLYGAVRLQWTADPITSRVAERVTTGMIEGVSGFKEERGYRAGLRYLHTFPLGVGLGATSSAANNAGLVTKGEVVDANFMRIAADLGVIGLALFVLVLAAAAWRAYGSRHRAAWLTFLFIHCGMMMSTNVLDSFYISQGFWLLLALMDCDYDPALGRATQRISPTAALTLSPVGRTG